MRERAEAYRPHIENPPSLHRRDRGRRLGCAEVPSLVTAGVTCRKVATWGWPGLPNNGLTLFIATSGARQTLVNQRPSGLSAVRPLTCRNVRDYFNADPRQLTPPDPDGNAEPPLSRSARP
jgi:hypothetical protein